MNKLIRVFSYILMILGALIVLGGLGSGIFMLFARMPRMMEHSFPAVRMMGSGAAGMSGFRAVLEGLLVSGFGMILYLLGEIVKPKNSLPPEIKVKTTRAK